MKIEAIQGEIECLDVMIMKQWYNHEDILKPLWYRKEVLRRKIEEAKKKENE